MNSHAEIQRLLPAYCGGDLEPAERKLVEQHLAACPSCRAELANLQTALRLIRSTPEVDPPPWMAARIMARIREQQTEKQSWLRRMFFPLHIKLPLEVMALLVVCVGGFYLSRTVETNLEQAARQQLQEPPAQQAPSPAQLAARGEKTKPTAAKQPRSTAPPSAIPQPAPRGEGTPFGTAPPTPATPAPAPYAPAPPAYRDQQGDKAEPMKASPAGEPYNRALEQAPEVKSKSSRSVERRVDAATPAPAGRAAGVPAPPALPQSTVRLSVDDTSAAPAMIREAVLRSGGDILEEHEMRGQRLKVRIPAARQNELLQRLERLGRITERPVTPPPGTQLLELTVQW